MGERFLKWLGESGGDFATHAATVGGLLDPVIAGGAALASYAVPYGSHAEDESLGQRFMGELDNLRAQRAEASARSPDASILGTLAPALAAPEMLASAPSFSGAAATASLPVRMAAGTMDAGVLNAGATAASNIGNAPLDKAGEAAMSPWNLLGAAFPAAEELGARIPRMKQAVAEKIAPKVTPTPSSIYLREHGVESQTVGQMAPKSALGQFESVAAHDPLFGSDVAAQRAKPMHEFQDAALRQGVPPGMELPTGGTIKDRLEQMYQGFKPAYDEIRGERVFPAIHDGGNGIPLQSTANTEGAFDRAAKMPGTMTGPEREAARSFLDDQLSILPGGTSRPAMVKEVDAGDLLQIRSNIRDEIRAQPNPQIRRILNRAADDVTQVVESQLSPKAAQHLEDVERRYAQYKVLEDAVYRGNDPTGEFNPKNLWEAAKGAAPSKSKFARGTERELEELASHGRQVLMSEMPKTGFVAAAAAPIPKGVRGALAVQMNSPEGKALLLREQLRAPLRPGLGQGPAPIGLGLSQEDSGSTPQLRLLPGQALRLATQDRPSSGDRFLKLIQSKGSVR